jgi:predicted acyltransferase
MNRQLAADAVAYGVTSSPTDRPTDPSISPPTRLVSIDVFRGLIMFMMLAHVFALCRVAERLPEDRFWATLCWHWSHAEWRGTTLHDIIQPGFSFLVGTALAFSVASRRRRGESTAGLIAHAAYRSVVLVFLGILLRSLGHGQTHWTFEDTLTQIGLGYLPLVLIAIGPRWLTWKAIVGILIGYWAAFATHPLPGPGFDHAAHGVDAELVETGFAAHWNKNSNLAWTFDVWFLNLFPREATFTHNPGGYSTLSFIPTLATMLLGLIAGHWLREARDTAWTLGRFLVATVICLTIGYGLDATGICPSVKRIWTPAWVLVSGGYCFAILGTLHAICDRAGYRAWAFPWVVFGTNSITAYVMDWTLPGFVKSVFSTHLGEDWAGRIAGQAYASLLSGGAVLSVLFAILWWMHGRRVYIKI